MADETKPVIAVGYIEPMTFDVIMDTLDAQCAGKSTAHAVSAVTVGASIGAAGKTSAEGKTS